MDSLDQRILSMGVITTPLQTQYDSDSNYLDIIAYQGAFSLAVATECLPSTAKCSEHWERILPHQNLMSSEEELDAWCSKQALLYDCLEDVLLEGRNGNLSYLPTNLLISKLFSQDLCTDGSTGRTRLLSNADCINQLNTDFCILPEYLDIVSSDDAIPSTRCSQAEKTFSCIAATMVLNCGFDAGRVYRTMLKITRYSDEVCGIETSEGIPCEEKESKSDNRNENLSEMYYGFFHRMGDMLDQNEIDSISADNSEVSEDNLEKLENAEEEVTEAIQTSIENLEENLISEELDNPDNLENLEHAEEEVTEAIQTAIESLEENLISEELDNPEYLGSAPDSPSVSCSKDIEDYKPYMKSPTITEIFKGFLFYNYSGIEYALYWRQPLFSITDRIECKQLQPNYMKVQVFRCRIDDRYKDPDCVSNATVYEELTPEFIRSFDPEIPCDSTVEFGPRPEWLSELDKVYNDRKIRELTGSTQASIETGTPEALTTCATLLRLAGTMCSATEMKAKWHENNFQLNNMNPPLPKELYYEILSLAMPEPSSELPPMSKIKIGDSMFFLIYNQEFAKSRHIENITCRRMDECHPRGKGLWKCSIWPRKMETCNTCGKYPTEDPTIGFEKYARHSKMRETDFTTLDTTEHAVAVDESGELQGSTPVIEPNASVFSGDSESKNTVEGYLPENELITGLYTAMNDEAGTENEADKVEYNLLSDSDIDDIGLQILNSVLSGDESEAVYAIEGTDAEDDDSQVIIATEDGLLAGNILVIKNASNLEDSKYTVVSVPTPEAI